MFVKFNKFAVSILCIFSEHGSVDFTSLSKKVKKINTCIKVSKAQFINCDYDNKSCILHSASSSEFQFFNFFVIHF
jgi:hypothetical protein